MIDIWVKLFSDQFELALNLTRAVFGTGGKEAPVSVQMDPAVTVLPDQADATATSPESEPTKEAFRQEEQLAVVMPGAATIPDIISFLESASRGATVREIAEHLEMDKRSILPLLRTLVKERRIDELLGRYCVLKS